MVCLIGCQDNSRYIDPTIDKPDSPVVTNPVTQAQLQRAADNANAMRQLADAIDAGTITTMTEANTFTRQKALDNQTAFNKVFASEIGKRLGWSDEGTDDNLPKNAAEVFRSLAAEFDLAAGKKPEVKTDKNDIPSRDRRRRAVRVR